MCSSHPAKKTLSFILLFFFLCPPLLMAMDVTLQWDPNTDPDCVGYRLFVREAAEGYYYSNPEWEGTENGCTIRGLDEYESYYFVVRAVDTEGRESGNSNEVYLPSSYATDKSFGSGTGSGGPVSCFITSLFGPGRSPVGGAR
jgi:hypothetical protein